MATVFICGSFRLPEEWEKPAGEWFGRYIRKDHGMDWLDGFLENS